MATGLHKVIAVIACLLAGAAIHAADTRVAPETGFTAEGDPYVGSPAAPVVIEEWSDYLCPFCARHFAQTTPQLIDRYVRDGRLRLVFRDSPIAALHPTAALGHRAARCVGEQGAANYWEMHAALFDHQKEWSRLPDPTAFLQSIVASLGFDTKRYSDCMNSSAGQPRIEANRAAGQELGFNGTPSFRLASSDGTLHTTLDGAQPIERFDEIVQSLLAGEQPALPAPPPRPALPAWARPEGWAPDAARPGFNVAGDPYKGNLGARVAVIEFSDYQCAGCSRHALDVQPVLDREFVETGQVLWIVKSLPLKEHPEAVIAAAAAECAGDQLKFWPMHQALFAEAARWTNDRAEAELNSLAKQLGLDPAAFSACLAGRGALQSVLRDMYDAQDIVRTTPSFVLVRDGEGSLTGPLPADQFGKLLRRELERQHGAITPSP